MCSQPACVCACVCMCVCVRTRTYGSPNACMCVRAHHLTACTCVRACMYYTRCRGRCCGARLSSRCQNLMPKLCRMCMRCAPAVESCVLPKSHQLVHAQSHARAVSKRAAKTVHARASSMLMRGGGDPAGAPQPHSCCARRRRPLWKKRARQVRMRTRPCRCKHAWRSRPAGDAPAGWRSRTGGSLRGGGVGLARR